MDHLLPVQRAHAKERERGERGEREKRERKERERREREERERSIRFGTSLVALSTSPLTENDFWQGGGEERTWQRKQMPSIKRERR